MASRSFEVTSYCKLLFTQEMPIVCIRYIPNDKTLMDEALMDLCRRSMNLLYQTAHALQIKNLPKAAQMDDKILETLWTDQPARTGYHIPAGDLTFGAAAFAQRKKNYQPALAVAILIGLASYSHREQQLALCSQLDGEPPRSPGVFSNVIVPQIQDLTDTILPTFRHFTATQPPPPPGLPPHLPMPDVSIGQAVYAWFDVAWFPATITAMKTTDRQIPLVTVQREGYTCASQLCALDIKRTSSTLAFPSHRRFCMDVGDRAFTPDELRAALRERAPTDEEFKDYWNQLEPPGGSSP